MTLTTSPEPSNEPALVEDDLRQQFLQYPEIADLSESDRDALFEILRQAQHGDSSALQTVLRFAYEEQPVPMDEFVLGKRYMNLRGIINPEKVELLAYCDHPRMRHIYLACGKGSGKSFIVSIMLARAVYRLLCLRKPDMFYMLGPGSGIAAVNLSVSKEQARDVVYAEFKARIENSAWFKGKYKPFKYHATFPKKIAVFCQSKNPTVSYGYNTHFASLDEACFMIDNQEKSLAEDLTEAVMGSMASRFPNAYKYMAISTLRADDDFLSNEINRVKEKGSRIR